MAAQVGAQGPCPADVRRILADPAPLDLPLDGNRASAVLVPFLQRPGGPSLLMVRKSSRLRKHAGQVGFPGGSLDPQETAEQAALREAREEVGLEAGRVELLGRLDDERTWVTDFHIRPVVGWVADPPLKWQLDPFEIDDVLEIGLAELLATEPCSWMEWAMYGHVFAVPRWEFSGGRVVWGASARILNNLRQRFRSPAHCPTQ